MKVYATIVKVLLSLAVAVLGTNENDVCKSPQYVELGETGIIDCSFQEGFFGVFWYNSTNYWDDFPLLTYQTSVKGGYGFSLGEFDVHPNGSLIVNKVGITHEHSFSVSYLKTEYDLLRSYVVEVFVIVKPTSSFPLINHCAKNSKFCLLSSTSDSELLCYIQEARPPVKLQWQLRALSDDRNVSQETNIAVGKSWYNTRVMTTSHLYSSSILSLFVCKVINALPHLENESLALVQRNISYNPILAATPKYFQLNTRMELVCANMQIDYLVWKLKKSIGSPDENLVIASFIRNNLTRSIHEDYFVSNTGSLVVGTVSLQHEGFYSCWFNGNETEGVTSHNAIVYVPAPLVIEGCNDPMNCVLETHPKGNLTCSVKGIRPRVKLTWRVLRKGHSSAITFLDEQIIEENKGNAFDVRMTSKIYFQSPHTRTYTVVCRVAEPYDKLFHSSARVQLRIDYEEPAVLTTTQTTSVQGHLHYLWPVLGIVLLLILSFFIYALKTVKAKKRQRRLPSPPNDTTEEELPMMDSIKNIDSILKEKENVLVNELKKKYGISINSVKPIPYIKDKLFNINDVFIDGCIESLDLSYMQTDGIWRKLNSFEDIFTNENLKSERRIIEAEPGYGKSTLTLKLAYEWCNSLPSSCLNDVEILILLRLRQYHCVHSFYKAIKQLLLPVDTELSEEDIENVLKGNKSVLVLLDGFDEYANQSEENDCDIMRILSCEMGQNFHVILTTRTSVFPKSILPQTKRIRLTGFDREARKSYIQKAVVGNDSKAINKIDSELHKNPILGDLCEVPLLFVVFAHMSHEREQFLNLTSVTSYFRYIISTFHNHMRNKMTSKEAMERFEKLENEHYELDRIAFEGLAQKRKKTVWDKQQMREEIGYELFDLYVNIGILVEDEVLHIIDDPSVTVTNHVRYRVQVRFYHNLFCEWYAAHYISLHTKGSYSSNVGEFLRKFDPNDLQYVYRFACGLNPEVAKIILKYLQSYEGGRKFAILCILETTGKTEDILDSIRHICQEGVIVSGTDTSLLQRSTLQLLEIATKYEISICYVKLHNCIKSVDTSSGKILMESGVTFSCRILTEVLAIDLIDRDITKQEGENLLQFSSMCPNLKMLSFDCCVPPQVFNTTSFSTKLQRKNVKVEWQYSDKSPSLALNLTTGNWEDLYTNVSLSETEYNRLVSEAKRDRIFKKEEKQKGQVHLMRNVLSQMKST